jgi:hypothetical protein
MKSRRNVRNNRKSRQNRKSRKLRGGLFGFTNSGKTYKDNLDNWNNYWKTKPGYKNWNPDIDYPGMTNFGLKPPVSLNGRRLKDDPRDR